MPAISLLTGPKNGYKDRDLIFWAQVVMGPALIIMQIMWGCAPQATKAEAAAANDLDSGSAAWGVYDAQPVVPLWAFVMTVLCEHVFSRAVNACALTRNRCSADAQIGFAAQ